MAARMAARPSKKRRDEDPEVDDSKTKEEKLMTENTRQRQTIRDRRAHKREREQLSKDSRGKTRDRKGSNRKTTD